MNEERLIENNVNLQNKLSKDLFENHSIGAMIMLLESGREIDFIFQNIIFGISIHNGTYLLSDKKNTQEFEDAWSVVVKGKLLNTYFIDAWKQIKIKTLY